MKEVNIDTDVPILGREVQCLQSFYGKRAESRKNTAKSMISPGDRPQEICTPKPIIDALLRVWPHIALDPCSHPESIVGALDTYYVPGRVVAHPKSGKPKLVFVAEGDEVDGLKAEWTNYTFVNPPFSVLEPWLDKARDEGFAARKEVAVLAPTRGHRKWFRDAVASATSVIDLDPVAFLGHKSSFPAPLCMIYWGDSKALFEFSFEELGDPR